MSSTRKCKSCGSLDIEVDPARGDAVCTNCGSVLETNIIVAEVQFEEGAYGSSNAIGQFVAADSKGGPTKFGASFHVGSGIESREMTLRKARNGITHLCSQLKLNPHCLETACNFFKMALNRNLTKGRRNTHVHAACVYLTCRTEKTEHLLIDISDVLQICCYELGRTYLKLSQALSINVPAVDPCLYIMRFAAKLEFGPKTQQVANTALRLVQRMKKDSIHLGRRPSGLCGAALLIAARLHEFNRSASDIVKIVKVHESTLRKRLIEFGDTPSSALTLEEFMAVDLEEAQDPPSFKVARKKDKERVQMLMEQEAESITELQQEIEKQLNRNVKKATRKRKGTETEDEIQETHRFIQESTMGTINKIIQDEATDDPEAVEEPVQELGPDIASMGLASSLDDTSNAVQPHLPLDVDLTFDNIDDEELDSYILSEHESKNKKDIWLERNAGYLEEQKAKAEKLQKEREEGKPEKRKRKSVKKKRTEATKSAAEAIEKIFQERKMSSKINPDALKSLNDFFCKVDNAEEEKATPSAEAKRPRVEEETSSQNEPESPDKAPSRKTKTPLKEDEEEEEEKNATKNEEPSEDDEITDYEEEDVVDNEPAQENNMIQMLHELNRAHGQEEEDYFGYDEQGEY